MIGRLHQPSAHTTHHPPPNQVQKLTLSGVVDRGSHGRVAVGALGDVGHLLCGGGQRAVGPGAAEGRGWERVGEDPLGRVD